MTAQLSELQRDALARLIMLLARSNMGNMRLMLVADAPDPKFGPTWLIDISDFMGDLGIAILCDGISIGSKQRNIDDRFEAPAYSSARELLEDVERALSNYLGNNRQA